MNTTLVHSPGLGNPLPHSWPKSLDIFSRVMGVDFESFITKPSVVSLCVQEIWNKTFNCKIPIIHHTIIESVLTATFLQLELWFCVVGLPATSRFLSTSAHYLESWLRNRQYLGVCMHQWQVSRLRRQFSSLTCDRRIPWNVRHRLIHFTSHGLCWVLWEPLTLLVVSPTLVNSLHHWLVIKWFLPCSTSTHSFTWLESYQFGEHKWRPWI